GGREVSAGTREGVPARAPQASGRARPPAGSPRGGLLPHLVFRTLAAALRREDVREPRLGAAIGVDRARRRYPAPRSGIRVVAVGGGAGSKRRRGDYRGVSGVEWASFCFKHT